MARSGQIVVLGDINIDVVLTVPAYPPEGGEGIATSSGRSIGGSAANTARALAWLGLGVRLIARTGADPEGDLALGALAGAGVDTRFVARDPDEATATNLSVVSSSGERTMFAYRGANARLAPADVAEAAFDSAFLLHLSGYAFLAEPQRSAALRAAELARARGLAIALDVPAGVTATIAPFIAPVLAHTALVFLGDADLQLLSGGGGAAALFAAGLGAIALKRGAGGSVLIEASGATAVPALPVTLRDSSGAGDAFAAGHIAARAAGLSPEATGWLANTMGAFACEADGFTLPPSRGALAARLAGAGAPEALLATLRT